MKIHGGPQRTMFSVGIVFSLLIFLSVLFFLLLIYGILQDNEVFRSTKYEHIARFRLLDVKTCASIFVSVVGLILVRYHFQLGFMPRLVSESKRTKKGGVDTMKFKGETFQVKIRNVGLGGANIISYKFILSLCELDVSEKFELSYIEVLDRLRQENLLIHKHFFLEEITPGYTFPTKDEAILWEIDSVSIELIKQLDLRIEFSGQLGGKYVKDVFLVPHRGLDNTKLEGIPD